MVMMSMVLKVMVVVMAVGNLLHGPVVIHGVNRWRIEGLGTTSSQGDGFGMEDADTRKEGAGFIKTQRKKKGGTLVFRSDDVGSVTEKATVNAVLSAAEASDTCRVGPERDSVMEGYAITYEA